MDATVIDGKDAGGRSRGPRRRWTWVIALGSSLILVGMAAHFSPAGPPAAAPTAGIMTGNDVIGLAPAARQWRFVKLGIASQAASGWTDSVPGRIAIDETMASKPGSPLSGHVSRVFVELGQRVRAGDPLFSVRSSDIAELWAGKEKAEVDLGAARTTLERVHATVASRAVPAKEEIGAQQQVRQAELALKLAEAKLSSLHVVSQGGNEFTVTSPRTGVVVEKGVLLGQQVTPEGSAALMVVADLSSVWVLADLFEGQAVDVRVGTAAQITSPATPDVTLDGRVEMVSSIVDPARHTVPVRIRLANRQGLLRPNIYARVRLTTAPQSSVAVEIAASAIVTDGARQYLYVQDPQGRFARRTIVTGPAHEGRVVVLQGLARGETVVEEGAILLDNQLALSK